MVEVMVLMVMMTMNRREEQVEALQTLGWKMGIGITLIL